MKRTKWKITDIMRAANEREVAKIIADDFRNGATVEVVLSRFNITFPRICGVTEYAWARMTHEQRCDVLVATAQRLGVPRNGR